MIARLKGVVEAIGEDHLVIDVHGVGYLVTCSSRTLARLPQIGEAVSLDIETKVREDAIQLFGFLSADERGWFRLLQDVQGVGAKSALSILSVLGPAELWQAIRQGDKTALLRAPGVGPKLAARLLMELKDKAPAAPIAEAAAAPVASGAVAEATSALINLGYKAGDAERAVIAAMTKSEATAPVAQLIRQALRELAR